jgi:GMP synthase (glutamine-hydrolysing)
MRKLLIIKTGSTLPSIYREHGDFEDFILRQIGITRREALIAPVYERPWLPDQQDIHSVIITGSGEMVTDRRDWSEFTASWLLPLRDGQVPVLGVCYGHQLLAHAYGGVVDYHPRGKETGTVSIELTAEGKNDRLLSSLPSPFLGQTSHLQTVARLPAGAVVLACNAFEPTHAFRLGGNIWGVQFHPEFTAEIMRQYLAARCEQLEYAGLDYSALYGAVQENPYGKMLLQRFMEL